MSMVYVPLKCTEKLKLLGFVCFYLYLFFFFFLLGCQVKDRKISDFSLLYLLLFKYQTFLCTSVYPSNKSPQESQYKFGGLSLPWYNQILFKTLIEILFSWTF